jgi:hypothetical protein
MRLEVLVLHVLHKGQPGHVLNEGHDEWGISTCPRRSDRYIPNFLNDVVKNVERFLLLDDINQILLIGWNSGGIANPRS